MMLVAKNQILSDGSGKRQSKSYLVSMLRKLLWLEQFVSKLPPNPVGQNLEASWRSFHKKDRQKFGREHAAEVDMLKDEALAIARGSRKGPLRDPSAHRLINRTISELMAEVRLVVKQEQNKPPTTPQHQQQQGLVAATTAR